MSGLPLKDFSLVVEYLSNLEALSGDLNTFLNIKEEQRDTEYKYTWDNYRHTLNGEFPQKIIALAEENIRFHVLIENPSSQAILLDLGEDGAERLASNNSAWKIPPREIAEIEIRESTIIWALPEFNIECDIIVSIHSDLENFDKGNSEEMRSPLILKKIVPTGQDFSLPIDFYNSKGRDYLSDKFDSQLGVTGHKFFTFSSFDQNIAQEGYEFGLDITPEIDSIIDYRDDADFVQLHEISSPVLDRLKLLFSAGWIYDNSSNLSLPKNPWKNLKTWISGGRILDGERKFKNLLISRDEQNQVIWDDQIIVHPSILCDSFLLGASRN